MKLEVWFYEDLVDIGSDYITLPKDRLIDKIARSLAHTYRYNGCLWVNISVARHSLNLVGSYEDNPYLALNLLLHDSAEAFLGDIVSPVKKLIPKIEEIEENILRAIRRAYDIPHPTSEERELIRKRDLSIISKEREVGLKTGLYNQIDHEDVPVNEHFPSIINIREDYRDFLIAFRRYIRMKELKESPSFKRGRNL